MSECIKKRFWKSAIVKEQKNGFVVLLDGHPIKTPSRATLIVPTEALADMIAAEWQAQDDIIDPLSMPFTRTSNAALDKVSHQMSEVRDQIAEYGETDLLCYRASAPRELVKRQAAAWDPLLLWAKNTFDAPLNVTEGLIFIAQPDKSLANLKLQIKNLNPFELSGLYNLVTLSGSLVAALAVKQGYKTASEIWDLCRVDNIWQEEQWGLDEEAQNIESVKRFEFLLANAYLQL